MQIYVNVDQDGNIIEASVGENIIPSKQFDFYFYSETEVDLDTVSRSKVVVNGFKAMLQEA